MIQDTATHLAAKFVSFVTVFFLIYFSTCLLCFGAEEEDLNSYKLWEPNQMNGSFGFYLHPLEMMGTFLSVKDEEKESELIEAIIARLASRSTETKRIAEVQLNLKDAVMFAIATNQDVLLASLKPIIADIDRQLTETVYGPTFFSEGSYYDKDREIQSVLDTGSDTTDGKDSLVEEGWYSKSGLKQPLSTGGEATLMYEADHLENNSDLTIPNPQYTSRVKLELRQSLLKEFGDRSNKAAIELADMATGQAEADYRRSLNNAIKEMALYYWRYKYYFQLEQISGAAVKAGQEILKKVQAKREQGLATELEENRAEASLRDREVTHIGDRRSVAMTLDQLKLLLGISPLHRAFDAGITPTEAFSDGRTTVIPGRKEVVVAALETREELSIARQQIKRAEVKMQLAKHLQLPSLDAKTSYTFNGLGEEYGDSLDNSVSADHTSWDVGLILEWSLDGEKGSLEYQRAAFLRKQAQLQYNRLIETIISEISTIHSELHYSAEEVLTADKATYSYQKVLEHEETLFDISRVSNQKLLDAQDSYFDAERSQLRALLNFNLASLKLHWAQGNLLEEFGIVSN